VTEEYAIDECVMTEQCEDESAMDESVAGRLAVDLESLLAHKLCISLFID
jgi:hypothetical protein